MLGEAASGGRPAGAAAALSPVLGHAQAQCRQVEHLAGLDPDHHRAGQVRAAPAAALRGVLHDLVGPLDLGQMRARGAGLLTRPAALGLLGVAPLRPRGLTQAVRGRRLGGVGGVPAEPALQLHHPRLQRGDQAGLLGVDRAQLGDHRGLDRDGHFQIGIGGRDRGLQDNKRSSPLAHGPYSTATPAAIPWSNRTRHGEREALNSYALTTFGALMVATNVFNNALRVDLDEYLEPYRRPAGGPGGSRSEAVAPRSTGGPGGSRSEMGPAPQERAARASTVALPAGQPAVAPRRTGPRSTSGR